MMQDFFLKAKDEIEFIASLSEASLLDAQNQQITSTHGLAIDIIGTIYEPTGETFRDEETGEEFPMIQAVEGYHANVRAVELPEALQQFVISAPSSPVRVWA